MMVNAGLTGAQHAEVRVHLRELRMSLTQARDALLHFKDDRLDRDKLEPAARRVDDLMNMFSVDIQDSPLGPVWITDVQRSVDLVTNPKVTDALRGARAEISALVALIGRG